MNVKEAVKKAREFIQTAFEDEQIKGVRLEEIEFLDRENTWKITLSFHRPPTGLQELVGAPRDYKSIVIDDSSRKVIAMRIRQLGDVF